MAFTCLDVANAIGLVQVQTAGQENIYRCPIHSPDIHPSFKINRAKDCFFCGPCNASGTAWEMLAFVSNLSANDRDRIMDRARELKLVNGRDHVETQLIEVCAYDYTNAAGKLLYQNVRYDPKTFRQRHPGPNGEWIWQMRGIERVPYNLPEILKCDDIIWVEGEKDVETLRAIGLVATTSGGVTSLAYVPQAIKFLKRSHRVTIIPDMDEQGKDFAKKLALLLNACVAEVRILELPGLDDTYGNKDVTDYIAQREPDQAADEIVRLIETAPIFTAKIALNSRVEAFGDEPTIESSWKTVIDENFIEPATDYLTRTFPERDFFIPDLIPQGVLLSCSGHPRSMKTLGVDEMVIACVTNTYAFALERFKPARESIAWRIAQEDPHIDEQQRMNAMLNARGITKPPENLFFSIHKSINLDDPKYRDEIFKTIEARAINLVIIDPIRNFSSVVDKGPAEVTKLTKWMRDIIVATGATIIIIHHFTKEVVDGNNDTRKRAHKTSGGGWFSAVECPIFFEKVDIDHTLVVPEDWKFQVDPPAFTFRIVSDRPHQPTSIALIGETQTITDSKLLGLDRKIIDYLSDHDRVSQNAVMTAVRANRGDVKDRLDFLRTQGIVDFESGKNNAKLWRLVAARLPEELYGE